MNPNKCVLVMAGGTGGHVFPALSVAHELMAQGFTIEWLGTARGIENELVTKANIKLHHLDIAGVRGKGLRGMLSAPIKILAAIMQARKIIKTLQPCAVLGFGGYATGPGGVAARLSGLPLVIHEQNAVAGLTNKLLAPISNSVLQAFPHALKNAKVVGNPVRPEVAALPAPLARYHIDDQRPLRVLVVGGSLGALALNQIVFDCMKFIAPTKNISLRHQVGKTHFEQMQKAYTEAGIEAEVQAFIDDMAASYAWADLVICRAGALTVAEVAAAGVAALFVPFPFAVDDHQTANAQFLVSQNAAMICQQAELSGTKLAERLNYFAEHREELLNIACNAKRQAISTATAAVVDEIKKVCCG